MIQRAWSKANTVYGKIALVFFYTFIWINIVSAACSLCFPSSQGVGCLFDKTFGAWEKTFVLMFVRGINLFMLGFFSLAHVRGIEVWNVALVAFLTVTWTSIVVVSSSRLESLDEEKYAMATTCPGFNDWIGAWIWSGWGILALIFAIMQSVLGGSNQENEHERTALTG